MHNDIINSIIIHDSVLTNIYLSYGISLAWGNSDEVSDEEIFNWSKGIESKEDIAFNEYDSIMRLRYSQYVVERNDENGNIVYEPLGELDENVFYNEKAIYICDGVIIKKLEDGVMSCLYYNYPKFKDCKTCNDVSNSSNKSLAHVTNYSQNNNSQFIRSYTFKDKNYDEHPKHRLSVTFDVRAIGFWFGSEIHEVTMIARNEHRCKDGSYRKVACETKITAPVATSCPWTDEWKVRFNTGWCPMTPGMIYYRKKIFRCGCSKTHFTLIEIDAKNQHGVTIKDKLQFS